MMEIPSSQLQGESVSIPPTPCSPDNQSEHFTRLSKALTRKRERDRHNQQQKRKRERQQVDDLKSRVYQLERELEEANLSRSRLVPSPEVIVRSVSLTGSRSCSSNCGANEVSPGGSVDDISSPVSTGLQQDHVNVSLPVLNKVLELPEWLRIPLWNVARPNFNFRFLERGQGLVPLMAQLRATPSLAEQCPPHPKPIDLLFGGSNNLLANFVVSELADLPLLSPEKFASCWHIYMYCRWLIWPSKESYERLPVYLRPTAYQLVQDHHLAFDVILWPQLRENLIRNGPKYEVESLLGLLSCTYRIRGTFAKDFIRREQNGEPQVTEEFYLKFMDISNWGVLERFWREYPELTEGLDSSVMLREENLMSLS